MLHTRRTKTGFTLVELLVVISIIAVLLSILMPSLQRARGQAMQIRCMALMKQFGTVMEIYAQANGDHFTQARWYNNGNFNATNAWYTRLTPYFDNTKAVGEKIYNFQSFEEKEAYNRVWQKMQCPAERDKRDPSGIASSQGLPDGKVALTYAFSVACQQGQCPMNPPLSYDNGYGLGDWRSTRTRKTSEVKNPSSVMMFCDSRDTEVIYPQAYYYLNNFWVRYGGMQSGEWTLPVRHPSGFMVSYCDGHCAPVAKEVIRQAKPGSNVQPGHWTDKLWRAN
ncbi:MAG: hypothetical protein A2Y12_02510 [Planctomycetes bacterium GWF2_42_9]|nr:MAG: hypothetical protein A2Y12_02510 [Planctomycetes bacterium GWF2_42_9]